MRTFVFASNATSPGSPLLMYSRFRSRACSPETSWITFVRMLDPTPSSHASYVGRRWLLSRYMLQARSSGEACRSSRRKLGSAEQSVRVAHLVRTRTMMMRERVPAT